MAKSKSFALILGVLIMSFLVGYLVFAWQEPTAPPPGTNVPTPINVGTTAQTKQATLTINPGELQAQLFRDVDAGCSLGGGSWYINPSGASVLCGNLGIGTASPSNKLSVAGSNYISLGEGTNDPIMGIKFIDNTVEHYRLWYDGSTGSGIDNTVKLTYEPTGAVIWATKGGNLGIGTTNPGAKLEVAGQVKITGGNPGAGKVLTSDASGLASWQTPSAGVPSGVIVMWSGTLASIPEGWALCDGTQGTPDLRDRFILGVAAAENPGATGGATSHIHAYSGVPSHTHSITDPGHSHRIAWQRTETVQSGGAFNIPIYWPDSSRSGGSWKYTDSAKTGITVNSAGVSSPSTDPASSLPPYYKLAFIMKL